MSVHAEVPEQLARFSPEVQAAYRTFVTQGREDSARVIVRAVLQEFLPKRSAGATARLDDEHARLAEDLGYDSLAIAELVFFFEDLFKVTISTQDIRGVSTVGQLRAFVTRRVAETRATA